MKQHRWSGWPGAYCLDCFSDDPLEIAVADNREDEVMDDMKTHPEKYQCFGTGTGEGGKRAGG